MNVILTFLSYRKDRARHEQLARERLASLRAKRADKESALVLASSEDEQQHAIEVRLREEQGKEKDLLSQDALASQKGGIVTLQESILKELEKKHSIEIKVRILSLKKSLFCVENVHLEFIIVNINEFILVATW